MPRSISFRTAVLMAVVAAAAGCSSSATTPTTPTPLPTGSSVAIVVGNNFFSPATDTVAVGSTVVWTWTNTGTVPHSVNSLGTTSANSFTDSPNITGNGQTYSVTFSTAGTYKYNCAIHGAMMAGTLVVR